MRRDTYWAAQWAGCLQVGGQVRCGLGLPHPRALYLVTGELKPILPASPVYQGRTIAAMCVRIDWTLEIACLAAFLSFFVYFPHFKAGGNITRVAIQNTSTTFKAAGASPSSAQTLHKVLWRYLIEGSIRHCPQIAPRTSHPRLYLALRQSLTPSNTFSSSAWLKISAVHGLCRCRYCCWV